VWVSDDGSTDATIALLEVWRRRWIKGTFAVRHGPGKGFAENFRALLASTADEAAYYAFSDQDDIWDADKLSRALGMLAVAEPQRPGLYCSRTRLVDAAGAEIGMSPRFARQPDFRNALVQSIAGGNTMVMNRHGFAILAESARRTSFVSHDWWAYLIVSGAGGLVHYDPEPHVSYRQHLENLVGNNVGFRARTGRLRRLIAGQLSDWNAANLAGLECCTDLLTPDNRAVAAQFRAARSAGLPRRLYGIARARLYRQTRFQSATLWLAAAVNRL
jgi:glycosyltransferase involved in cell wall biosynthesis